jgi:tripartite-type tricarboxylate transporter receptor subunit TctC
MKWTLKALVMVLTLCAPTFAQSEEFPARQVQVVFPFGAGGGGDTATRIFAETMAKKLGQKFVVMNVPGANGATGANVALSAARDGYTYPILSSGSAIAYASVKGSEKELGYSLGEFEPVSGFAVFANVIFVSADSPFKTLGDVLAFARARPCELNVGVTTVNSANDLAAKVLERTARVRYQVVNYKTAGELMTGVLRGDVQVGVQLYGAVKGMVQSDKVRALAIVTKQRAAYLPDVPAVAETLPGYDVPSWMGFYVPKGVPKERVALLAEATRSALKDPELVAKFAALGFVPLPTGPEKQGVRMRDEILKWEGFFATKQEVACGK